MAFPKAFVHGADISRKGGLKDAGRYGDLFIGFWPLGVGVLAQGHCAQWHRPCTAQVHRSWGNAVRQPHPGKRGFKQEAGWGREQAPEYLTSSPSTP